MTPSELKAQRLEEFREKWPREKLGDYPDHAPAYTHPEGECTVCPVQCWNADDIESFLSKSMDMAAEEERKRIERLMYDEIGYSEIHHEQTAGLIRLHDALIHNQQERCVICEQGHDVPHRCNDQRNQNRAIPNYPKP